MTNPNLCEITPPDGTPLRWINAVLPIFIVVAVTLIGLYFNGRENLLARRIASPSFKDIIGAARSFEVLMWSSFAGVFVAGFLAMTQRILSLRETLDAWVSGIKAMFFAMIILVFAWTMGDICAELRTADYVIQVTRGFLSPHFIPLVTFIIASLISFATGTSWGTMSILVPIVIPLAHHFSLEFVSDPRMAETILIGTLGSVLSGSIFGDHCSPISDTTIMSSMSSGSDHVDHVRTQLPYAITVAVVAMLVGYFPIGFGFNPFYSLLLGSALLLAILFIIGKKIV